MKFYHWSKKSNQQKHIRNLWWSKKHWENIVSLFVVSNEPADGMALSGTRASVGTVMTKFDHHMYWPEKHVKG